MKRILIILLTAIGIVAAGAVAAVFFLDIDLKESSGSGGEGTHCGGACS